MSKLEINYSDAEKTIVQRIFEHGKASPDKPAIFCKDETVYRYSLKKEVTDDAEIIKALILVLAYAARIYKS